MVGLKDIFLIFQNFKIFKFFKILKFQNLFLIISWKLYILNLIE